MRNAFSLKTSTARIPDGKEYASAGIRLQCTREYVSGASGTLYLAVFAGLNNGVWCAAEKSGDAQPSGHIPHMGYTNHGMLNLAEQTWMADGRIAKWRMVSQALRLSLLNNCDENDGWFEAIRVQVHPGMGGTGWALADGGSGNGILGADTSNTLPCINVDMNMVEHPTYISGKLRDLHKYQFQLMCSNTDRDYRVLTNTTEADYFGNMLDPAFDAIYIKVHCRKATDGVQGSRLLAHIVSNQEVVYDETTPLARHMTKTTAATQILERAQDKTRNRGNTEAGWQWSVGRVINRFST